MTFLPQTVRRAAGAALLLLLAAALPLSSCGSGSSPTAAATPAPTTTETFTGTLPPGGTAAFPFTAVNQGTLTATLTSLAPQSTITVGFGIGTPSSGACALISGAYSESAKPGYVLSGTIAAGSYCVTIYDLGNMTGNNDYVLTVAHP